MPFSCQRRHRGLVQAAPLDWTSATMDRGRMAPAVEFVEVFERAGIADVLSSFDDVAARLARGETP